MLTLSMLIFVMFTRLYTDLDFEDFSFKLLYRYYIGIGLDNKACIKAIRMPINICCYLKLRQSKTDRLLKIDQNRLKPNRQLSGRFSVLGFKNSQY